MDTSFLEALVNRQDHQVLGRKLHPFCLFDALFLTLDDNPLFVGGRVPNWVDLETASIVCSTEPERLLSGMLKGPSKLLRLWRNWKRRRFTFVEELAKFQCYRADFDSRPTFWSTDEAGTSTKAPWVLSIAAFIEAHSNMTEREIMTAPIGLMMWKSAALAEVLGRSASELLSGDEQQAIEAIEQMKGTLV